MRNMKVFVYLGLGIWFLQSAVYGWGVHRSNSHFAPKSIVPKPRFPRTHLCTSTSSLHKSDLTSPICSSPAPKELKVSSLGSKVYSKAILIAQVFRAFYGSCILFCGDFFPHQVLAISILRLIGFPRLERCLHELRGSISEGREAFERELSNLLLARTGLEEIKSTRYERIVSTIKAAAYSKASTGMVAESLSKELGPLSHGLLHISTGLMAARAVYAAFQPVTIFHALEGAFCSMATFMATTMHYGVSANCQKIIYAVNIGLLMGDYLVHSVLKPGKWKELREPFEVFARFSTFVCAFIWVFMMPHRARLVASCFLGSNILLKGLKAVFNSKAKNNGRSLLSDHTLAKYGLMLTLVGIVLQIIEHQPVILDTFSNFFIPIEHLEERIVQWFEHIEHDIIHHHPHEYQGVLGAVEWNLYESAVI
uniref:Uncharacterized protein n=1 Tax=Fibrocapsa japonica TaxID=94617 RepID=A0A7S2V161_9STRA|mmetsp:Transcript_24138/g.35098  ORF Transcript_24138/g.35098 Transcript_24138/m.35098 type:complete len:424 (+) Transcript_24138:47-1318(+)